MAFLELLITRFDVGTSVGGTESHYANFKPPSSLYRDLGMCPKIIQIALVMSIKMFDNCIANYQVN